MQRHIRTLQAEVLMDTVGICHWLSRLCWLSSTQEPRVTLDLGRGAAVKQQAIGFHKKSYAGLRQSKREREGEGTSA